MSPDDDSLCSVIDVRARMPAHIESSIELLSQHPATRRGLIMYADGSENAVLIPLTYLYLSDAAGLSENAYSPSKSAKLWNGRVKR